MNRPHARTRLVVLATLTIILGAATTLAVGWGSVLLDRPFQITYTDLGQPDPTASWYGGVVTTTMATYVWRSPTWIDHSTFFGDKSARSLTPADGAPYWSRSGRDVPEQAWHAQDGFAELEEARGWPFRSMIGCTRKEIDLSKGGWVTVESYDAIELNEEQWKGGPQKVVPLRPILRGFLANTAIYSSGWAAVVALAAISLRVVRRIRGHCTRCGYDLQSNFRDGCPECGWDRQPTD